MQLQRDKERERDDVKFDDVREEGKNNDEIINVYISWCVLTSSNLFMAAMHFGTLPPSSLPLMMRVEISTSILRPRTVSFVRQFRLMSRLSMDGAKLSTDSSSLLARNKFLRWISFLRWWWQ